METSSCERRRVQVRPRVVCLWPNLTRKQRNAIQSNSNKCDCPFPPHFSGKNKLAFLVHCLMQDNVFNRDSQKKLGLYKLKSVQQVKLSLSRLFVASVDGISKSLPEKRGLIFRVGQLDFFVRSDFVHCVVQISKPVVKNEPVHFRSFTSSASNIWFTFSRDSPKLFN